MAKAVPGPRRAPRVRKAAFAMGRGYSRRAASNVRNATDCVRKPFLGGGLLPLELEGSSIWACVIFYRPRGSGIRANSRPGARRARLSLQAAADLRSDLRFDRDCLLLRHCFLSLVEWSIWARQSLLPLPDASVYSRLGLFVWSCGAPLEK